MARADDDDARLDASPWLYDVASDALSTDSEGEDGDELLDAQSRGTKPSSGETATREVQCAGVTASGARCTRTTRIPAAEEHDECEEDLFCYRHQHQRRRRSAIYHGARCCCCWEAHGAARRPRRRQHFWRQILAVLLLFGCSLAAASAGVAHRSVFLCAASACGLFVSVGGACVVACLAVSRALPPPANVDKVVELALATFNDTTREEKETRAPPRVAAVSA